MEVKDIELSRIVISKQNARKDLSAGTEEANLDDLASSIREKGLLSPITVVQKGDLFELIVGQRRYLACKKLGMELIPAIIRSETDDSDFLAISLIENIHRSDMSPIDKARAYNELFEKYQNFDRISKETGVSVVTIKKYMKLLDLHPDLQNKLSTSEGVVGIDAMSRLSSTFKNPGEQMSVYESISGFTGKVQNEIMKRSEGDLTKIPDLVNMALEGQFDLVTCKFGYCEMMSDKLKGRIRELITNNRSLDDLLR